MAALTIRGLTDELHSRLRVRAAENGRSMEAEVRVMLEERLNGPTSEGGLGSRIRARFVGLHDIELELPPRTEFLRAADFDS